MFYRFERNLDFLNCYNRDSTINHTNPHVQVHTSRIFFRLQEFEIWNSTCWFLLLLCMYIIENANQQMNGLTFILNHWHKLKKDWSMGDGDEGEFEQITIHSKWLDNNRLVWFEKWKTLLLCIWIFFIQCVFLLYPSWPPGYKLWKINLFLIILFLVW